MRIQLVKPLDVGEIVSGHEFLERSRALALDSGRRLSGHSDYLFFRRKDNWPLLPGWNSGINIIVFAGGEPFNSPEGPRVPCLYRFGFERDNFSFLLCNNFPDYYWVAVEVLPQPD